MADLKDIELARPGMWQLASGKTEFTVDHLRDAADFYAATGRQKLGIGLGHNDPRFTGDPSFGNITNVRYEEDDRGPVLKGDVVDMPDWLHAAAPKRWPNRSIEGFQDFEYGDRKYKLVLTGMALLGATPPGVQNIQSLQDLQLALAASAARRIVAMAPEEPEPDDVEPVEAMYSPEQPRVPAGSGTGGQFAPAGGGAQEDKPKPEGKKPAGKQAAPPKPNAKPGPDIPDGQLGFDGKRGTGYGNPDARVKDLQAQLNRLHVADDGHRRLRVDGEFGPLTTQAVKKAQQRLGMEPTGIISPAFIDKLKTLDRLPRAKRKTTAAGQYSGVDEDENAEEHVLDDGVEVEASAEPAPPPPDPQPQDPEAPAASGASSSPQPVTAVAPDPTAVPAEAATTNKEGAGLMDPAKIREGLGLAPDASDDEVKAALVTAGLAPPAPAVDPGNADQRLAANAARSGLITIDPSQLKAYEDGMVRAAALAKRLEAQERDTAINKAIEDGKFPPARKQHYERMWDADPDGAKELIASLAAGMIPVTAMGYGTDAAEDAMWDHEFSKLFPKEAGRG